MKRYTSKGWEDDVWQEHPDSDKIYYRGVEMTYHKLPKLTQDQMNNFYFHAESKDIVKIDTVGNEKLGRISNGSNSDNFVSELLDWNKRLRTRSQ